MDAPSSVILSEDVVAELRQLHAETVRLMRADRVAGDIAEPEEVHRRCGVLSAVEWLTNPRETVGPYTDGPAYEWSRIWDERGEAQHRVRALHRGGYLSEGACRALGVLQVLEFVLGHGSYAAVLTWPRLDQYQVAA